MELSNFLIIASCSTSSGLFYFSISIAFRRNNLSQIWGGYFDEMKSNFVLEEFGVYICIKYKRYIGKIILEEAQFRAKIERTTPVLYNSIKL